MSAFLQTDECILVTAALDYYLETLHLCEDHTEDEHGDEKSCIGWGPKDLAKLSAAADKIDKGCIDNWPYDHMRDGL